MILPSRDSLIIIIIKIIVISFVVIAAAVPRQMLAVENLFMHAHIHVGIFIQEHLRSIKVSRFCYRYNSCFGERDDEVL